MVRWSTIRYLLWHLCLNIQKVKRCQNKFGERTLIQSISKCIPDLIKDSARPSYWVPDRDREANFCCVCTKPFGTAEALISNATGSSSSTPELLNDSSEIVASGIGDRRRHHCRSCGQAVCDDCSQNRRPVPERGWNSDVRVCDTCNKKSPAP